MTMTRGIPERTLSSLVHRAARRLLRRCLAAAHTALRQCEAHAMKAYWLVGTPYRTPTV